MKKKLTDQLVYDALFPRPKPNDPYDFSSFLERNLVLEVRQEVHAFYGHISDLESKYPGLDYTHPTHRLRLSRWQWHRRLFRAFDSLGLTDAEIHGLTKWEGTKWAKERYERDQGIVIRDTTADFIGEWIPPEERTTSGSSTSSQSDQEAKADDSDDEVQASVGVELNERLVQRAAAHLAGDMSEPLDEEWEQWLKAALEAGEFPLIEAELQNRQAGNRQMDVNLAHVVPQHIMAAASSGRWSDVPSALQNILRSDLQRNGRSRPEPAFPASQSVARRVSSNRNGTGTSGAGNSRRPIPAAGAEQLSLADPVQPLPPTRERELPPAYGHRSSDQTRRRTTDRLEAETAATAALLERVQDGIGSNRAEAEFFSSRIAEIAERTRLRTALAERRPYQNTQSSISAVMAQATAMARGASQSSETVHQGSSDLGTASSSVTRTAISADRPDSIRSNVDAEDRSREAGTSRETVPLTENHVNLNTTSRHQGPRQLRLPTTVELRALEEAAAADRRSLLNIQRDLTSLTQRYHELHASSGTGASGTRRQITVRMPSAGATPSTAEQAP